MSQGKGDIFVRRDREEDEEESERERIEEWERDILFWSLFFQTLYALNESLIDWKIKSNRPDWYQFPSTFGRFFAPIHNFDYGHVEESRKNLI